MDLLRRLYTIDLRRIKKEEIVIHPIFRAFYAQASSFLNNYYIQIKGYQLFSDKNKSILALVRDLNVDLDMDLSGVEDGFLKNTPLFIKLTLPYYFPAIASRIAEEAISRLSKKDIRGVFSHICADITSFSTFFNMLFKNTLPFASVAYAEYMTSLDESSKLLIAGWGITSSILTLATWGFLLHSSLKQYTSPEFLEKFNNLSSFFGPVREKVAKYIKKTKP
ncbi:MAG: hypothetical protein QXU74_02290 [Candidatus Aenigmatarchaeota archaeon]